MKLDSIKLKNFRGYKDETLIPISDLTAFIGKNDAGKSSILEALEIFFNNSSVTCEKDDLNKNATDNKIEITCTFKDFPNEIVIDAAIPTTLLSEYLLNNEDKLEIKKVFTATVAKPRENIYIVCNHPSLENVNDLLTLKRTELIHRANTLEIPQDNYNGNVNSSIRQAIRANFTDLQLQKLDLLVDKEDTKKVYEALKKYLPLFALFQSDRQSKDDDKEVTDPMNIAIQKVLLELNTEIEYIKTQVRNKAVDTANRTLEKLKEMCPELADELIPEFKTEPKFDKQFKLTIKSEDNIPINKRGSGVRRLILLNFFRAEAERRRDEIQDNHVIFAFEEPETSQHPDHQELLINAFIELSAADNSQILLTTHTPALAGLLPLSSLRFIEKDGFNIIVQLGDDQVFEKIADTLGILPDPISNNATALLLVEGKGDVVFVNYTAEQLKNAGYISHTFAEKRFAIVPIGGCGNLKHWRTQKLAEQFNLPWCILLDSDKGTPEENINSTAIQQLRADGIKAYITQRREPENYIHYDCLQPCTITYSETDDAKRIISQAKRVNSRSILEFYWTRMTAEQIREVEQYDDNGTIRYEFTDMFLDFLKLV